MKIMLNKVFSVILCLVMALALFPCAVGVLAEETAAGDRVIVSMGDSFSSGEGLPPFYGQDITPVTIKVKNQDWLAHRSENSWPGQLKFPALSESKPASEFKDDRWFFVASSAALTDNITKKQKKEYNYEGEKGVSYIDPQIDVFNKLGGKEADYVTLTIGGNDAQFTSVVKEASVMGYFTPSALSDKLNSVWGEFYKDGGIRDDLRDTYKLISETAGPQAKIIVAGYPKLLDSEGSGMFPSAQAVMVNDAVVRFNDEIESLVEECKADGMRITFVSVEEEFSGHEAYTKKPYINPVKLKKDQDIDKGEVISSYSIHPNADGAKAYARCVQKKIDEIEKDGGKSEWPDYTELKDEKEDKKEIIKDTLDVEIGTVKDSEYITGYGTISNLEYTMVYLSEEDGKKYPKLKKALDVLNSETKESSESYFEELTGTFKELYETGYEPFGPYEVYDTLTVKRADSVVFSMFGRYYEYTGGAHGFGSNYGINYNTETGTEIELSDVVKDEDAFFSAVAGQIEEEELFPGVDVVEHMREQGINNITFLIDHGGVTVYFSPYEIGPYASGVIDAYLPFDAYSDILDEKYFSVPESFAFEIKSGESIYCDVTGDGAVDEIMFYETPAYYDAGKYSISVNGNVYEEEAWFYESNGYFFRTENGKYGMLLRFLGDSDHSSILCFEISDDIRLKDDEDFSWNTIYDTDRNMVLHEVITSPDSFILGMGIYVMATDGGSSEFCIDESFNIAFKEDKIHMDTPLSLKTDLTVKVYDEKEDKTTGEEVLTAGEKVLFYAVDIDAYSAQEGTRYIYLKTDDGRTFRAEVDIETWPRSIDGVSVNDIFEGLVYAG